MYTYMCMLRGVVLQRHDTISCMPNGNNEKALKCKPSAEFDANIGNLNLKHLCMHMY